MLKLLAQATFLHVKRLLSPLKPILGFSGVGNALKAYSMHNTALLKPAKAVVSQNMNDAQNCVFSCDGSWQKRDRSSMDDCITMNW